ncbi:hypothetical protein M9Y10_020113 [Tritrichomonas musculus]|uniref:Uncharacterized protein n=1 Tax=Tritrichomonas musculus TaxID=1915356 RepID=A0ABR2HF89_9EUKA
MLSEGNQQFPEPLQQSSNENAHTLDQNEINTDNSANDQDSQTDNTNNTSDDENAGDEALVDMFSYYFLEFLKETEKLSSPTPSYFAQLSNDEKHLLRVFKQYYNEYKIQTEF